MRIRPLAAASCLTSLVILAGFSHVLAQEASGFPDVPKDHWAAQAVTRLKSAGVVRGSAPTSPRREGTASANPSPEVRKENRRQTAKNTQTSKVSSSSHKAGRMKIEAGSTLVMIGDSITDAGRGRPVGQRSNNSLGGGYVNDVDSLLGTAYPERKIRVLNTGISGNTVRDLKNRWQTDVVDLKPDWLSIMIGTNDVWRQFDAPNQPEIHVLPEEYERTLDELVAKMKPTVKGLVLMTPFYVQPNTSDPMRTKMDAYGRIVKRVAEKHGVIFVDTQAAYNAAMQHHDPLSLAGDRVHPSPLGHMVLARAFLSAVGFEWR